MKKRHPRAPFLDLLEVGSLYANETFAGMAAKTMCCFFLLTRKDLLPLYQYATPSSTQPATACRSFATVIVVSLSTSWACCNRSLTRCPMAVCLTCLKYPAMTARTSAGVACRFISGLVLFTIPLLSLVVCFSEADRQNSYYYTLAFS